MDTLPPTPLVSIIPRDAALPTLPTDEELQTALALFDAAADRDTARRLKAAARTERPRRK